MDDLISRQDVLALAKDVTLQNGCKHRCIDATMIHELPPAQLGTMAVRGYPIDADYLMAKVAEEYGERARDALYRIIRYMPPAQSEQQWIPVSERLPEENMWTICQNNAGAMMIGKYDIEFGWMFPAYFDGTVAWMPLPEQYREEGKQDG